MNFSQYIESYEDYFWQPVEEEGTTVFCMPGGETIVYGKLLMRIIGDLAGQGLPYLGSLLLALVATNHSTTDPLQRVEDILRRKLAGLNTENAEILEEMLENAIYFLRTLAAVPIKYSTGDARIQLFQALFAGAHGLISIDNSKKIVRESLEWVDVRGRVKAISQATSNRLRFVRDIKCLSLLRRAFPDEESIIAKLKPVPAIPEPISLEQEKVPGKADFVESLVDHPTTFPVGALIKSIWSGLNVPIHHRLPGVQPLGGFSDLSNKGSYDRLLISEFANEEWVLLSRLANNEALFLHREIPPGVDDLQRVLLLDISLKSWGTPKLIAYAILLAIARHPRTDIQCEAFAVGSEFQPIRFASVDEVIASLSLLDGSLDPAAGIVSFFGKRPKGVKLEVIFIAPAETLARPSVLKAMSDHQSAFKYWISVGRDGEIDLYKNQGNSRRLVQQIRLPLTTLWADGRSGRRTERHKTSLEFAEPAESPVLYPPAARVKAWMAPADGEIYIIDKMGKLFRRNRDANLSAVRAWELLFKGIPSRMTHFEIGDDHVSRLLLCYSANTKELILYDIATGGVQPMSLDHWKQSPGKVELLYYEDCFYLDIGFSLWTISNGAVTSIDGDGVLDSSKRGDLYRRRKLREEEAIKKNKIHRTVLRHLKRVAINAAGNLLFNKHELLYKESGHFGFELAESPASREVLVLAQWEATEECFLFPGGGKVSMDPSGMILLEWPDGANPLFDVVVWNAGPNKLNLVRTVREQVSPSLVESKMLVDSAPSIVLAGAEHEKAKLLTEQLAAVGATADAVPSAQTIYIPAVLESSIGIATPIEFAGNDFYCPLERALVKTHPAAFFEKNISSYIQTVSDYGAYRKTSS